MFLQISAPIFWEPQWSIDHDTVVDYIIAHTKPEENITAPTATVWLCKTQNTVV